MPVDDPGTFEYGTFSRNAFLLVAAAILAQFAAFGLTVGPPARVHSVGYWLGNGVLVAIFTWPSCWIMHRRRLRTTHPIELTESGVVFARNTPFEATIAWTDLKAIERLSIRGAPRYGGLRGILIVGTDVEIPVLGSLRGFGAFSAALRRHALAAGVPFPPNG